jgi:8-oxo-dGTP pyrophosphatase MutT (NUDIX family)
MLERWKTLASKKVFKCRWFIVDKNKVKLPSKKAIDYFRVVTPPSVMIVAKTSSCKIIFTRQYRYPIDDFFIELPAGRTEGRSSLSAAKAELEEEAGYKAKNFKKIGEFVPWNGVGTEICYVFLATGLLKTSQKLDEAEFMEVLEIPIKKVWKMVDENKIKDGMTLAALDLARKYLK